MTTEIFKEMLLIENVGVEKLFKELSYMAGIFLAPAFLGGLVMQFFGKMEFGEILKRLLIVAMFMSCFYSIHAQGVSMSLELADKTMKKVSPNNLFIKKWYHQKLETKKNKNWSLVESFVIPNLNDFVATALFLLAKVCLWLLKLIYSTVYHFTYIFSGIAALMYFFASTNRALVGVVRSSIWCVILPFVVLAILAMVGNTLDENVMAGQTLGSTTMVVWVFGITLLLLIAPVLTHSFIKGDGFGAAGAKMGQMSIGGILLLTNSASHLMSIGQQVHRGIKKKKRMRELAEARARRRDEWLERYAQYGGRNYGHHNQQSGDNSSRFNNEQREVQRSNRDTNVEKKSFNGGNKPIAGPIKTQDQSRGSKVSSKERQKELTSTRSSQQKERLNTQKSERSQKSESRILKQSLQRDNKRAYREREQRRPRL